MKSSKKNLMITLGAILMVVTIGITYAFITQMLTGTKEVVINAGVLDLVLEEENAITISDALPMYDEVGMIQEDVFVFRLVNKTTVATDYILKLQEIGTETLDKTIVKYGLIKDDEKKIDLISNLTDEIIDEGTIEANDTINYELRLWIDSSVTDETIIAGKSISFKLALEGGQEGTLVTEKEVSIEWSIEDGYLETVEDSASNSYFIKLTNDVLKKEDLLGLQIYMEANSEIASCGSNCIIEDIVTEETIFEMTGVTMYQYGVIFVFETTTQDGTTLTPGVWINADLSSDGTTLIPLFNELKIKEQVRKTFTFAGVTKEAVAATLSLFNYTSEGCISAYATNGASSCSGKETNGIYMMDDDDGPSYFYRGQVDNLVKFGEYKKDYYVYRYTNSTDNTYDFSSLDACKFMYSDCTEKNKVLKHSAGTPMYWRIIRINGDGTIRMIYSGTTPDSTGENIHVGISTYNQDDNYMKYVGYTYDKSTSETPSFIKTELEKWYANTLDETTYNDKIVTNSFCNDTSDYKVFSTSIVDSGEIGAFGPGQRLWPIGLNIQSQGAKFICSPTDKDFGGNYNLKVGLITLDEVLAAGGGLMMNNESYYLYGGYSFWTMSPTFNLIDIDSQTLEKHTMSAMASVNKGGGIFPMARTKMEEDAGYLEGGIRPVINLSSDVVFKEGTDGSTLTPYELAE